MAKKRLHKERGKEKHVPYFRLLDALREADDCALCELEAADLRRYFDGLLYECVNDAVVREKLIRSKGYCPRHAHLLTTFRDGLGTAILYREQLELALRFLEDLGGMSARRLRKDAVALWTRHESCPACRVETESREGNLAVLLEGLSEPEMRKTLAGGPGLCLPHLLSAVGRAEDAAVRAFLLELHCRKLKALADELSEYLRKQDYRFRDEGIGREGDSWLRAVRMMVGRKDVF